MAIFGMGACLLTFVVVVDETILTVKDAPARVLQQNILRLACLADVVFVAFLAVSGRALDALLSFGDLVL